MFGRNKKNAEEDIEEVEVPPRLSDEDADIWSEPGPRNYGEVDASDGYVDMGSILFPAVQGMQLRTQVADDGTTVLQILVVLGSSGIQMSVAAAPRSGGVWEELREEIRKGFEDQGAKVADYPTRYGNELLVDMPMQMPDGRSATSRMRILGPAAANAEAGVEIEKVIDRIIVRRDEHPRTRLELLPVHLPAGAQEA